MWCNKIIYDSTETLLAQVSKVRCCSYHEGPVEALEALIDLGGVGEEQEERCQELYEGSSHKRSCCRGHKAHKVHKGQYLRRIKGKT